MSTNNTDDASQAAEAEFILALETSFYEVAAGFVLWGMLQSAPMVRRIQTYSM